LTVVFWGILRIFCMLAVVDREPKKKCRHKFTHV
jgi:hypothetical protein